MKTSELTGAALDWAVTRANYEINHETVWEQDRDTCQYSTDWAQAGPIIERERIQLRDHKDIDGHWTAMTHVIDGGMVLRSIFEDGPAPLVAAMRAYVASKMGDTVDVPDDLV